MKISILVPSRGRPDKLWKLVETALDTATGDIEILAYIDKSDPCKAEYKKLAALQPKLKIFVGPDSTVAWAVNMLGLNATGDAVMPLGDDTVFCTYAWDGVAKEAKAKFPEGLWMAGVDDGRSGFSHIIYDREWFNALGYWWPVIFNHWGADEWLTDIAKHQAVNRYVMFKEFLVRHDKVGEACQTDETYHRIRGNTNRDRDLWIKANMERYWLADLNKILSHIGMIKARNSPRVKNYVRTHE